MDDGHETPMVLLVDDERQILRTYETVLGKQFEVRAVGDGDAALDAADGGFDVAVLDRRMPGTSGDELLRTLRDRGHGAPAAMLSAIAPDTDIVGLPLDHYLVKPVGLESLERVVELLVAVGHLDERNRKLFRTVSKLAALERHGPSVADREDGESGVESGGGDGTRQTLRARIEDLRADLGEDNRCADLLDRHPDDAFRAV